MRVLWVAFACAPGCGSEPGMGYALARALAPHVEELVILTASHNKAAIEAASALPSNLELVYVPAPSLRGEVGHRISYLVWLARALRRAKELHAAAPFDLVHHVTYAMSWIPPLPGRLGAPFIWNAGNTLTTPFAFLSARDASGGVAEVVRNIAVGVGWGVSKRLVRAEVVTMGHSLEDVRVRSFFLPALDPQEVLAAGSKALPQASRFRIVSVGRLLFVKAFHLGLEAFARACQPGWEYVIVGSGPEEGRLRDLARRLQVLDQVRFEGWRSRTEVFELLSGSDVFMLPSLHDSFSWAALEAMAAGLPVICLDRGGPALLVDDEVGVKVKVRRPEEVVEDLADALKALAADAEKRSRMGEEARRRVLTQHTWQKRAEEIASLYREVLAARACEAERRKS